MIPTRLRAARLAAGYAQAQIASILGTRQTTISRYERGAEHPGIARIREFCLVYGVSADALLGLAECPECGRTCEANEARSHCQ